jgi:hypothetical protein
MIVKLQLSIELLNSLMESKCKKYEPIQVGIEKLMTQ